MKVLKLLFILSVTSIFAQVPTNNDCANAELITVPTNSTLTISRDYAEATESLDASCNNANQDNRDLWYEFTMPIDGIFRISNTSVLNFFTIYESCGGAEIACMGDDSSYINLVNGNTYLLRASFQFASTTSFSVQAFAPIANDECVNRETITISTSNFTQPAPNSSLASTSLSASCDSSSNTYLDLWYEFVMPVTGTVDITFSNNTQTFSLYDSCAGTELQCFSNNGVFQNLQSGSTYILRVAERTTDAGTMNFRLQAYEYATNNDCANSENIIIETANTNTYQTDLRTATESLDSSCEIASNTNYDLWYNFTMPVTGNIKIDQLTANERVTIYDACGGNEISCQSGLHFVSGLQAGINYSVRISSNIVSNRTPRFQAFTLATNDDCDNSENITIPVNNTSQFTVDVRTATESLDSSCDTATNTNLDLWYNFTMPVTGNLQISNSVFDLKTTLFDACSGTEIDCGSGNFSYTNLSLNTNYLLRISQRTNDAISRSFSLQAFENIFNDDCATPQDITVIENDFSTYSTNNSAATNSVNSSCEPSGESNTVSDVWYRFTMPTNNDIAIEHLTNNILGYYALYDACGNAEIQCFTNDGFFNNLTQGNEYLLKVGNLSSQSGDMSFQISVQSETLGTKSSELENINIYPNPTTGILNIQKSIGLNIQQVSILDLNGRILKREKIQNETLSINISELPSSIYMLVLEAENKQIVKRIVKL